jgi:DNA-directed RNA polymerase specialized sigma24 family protein
MAQLDEKDLIKHLSDQLENVLFELPANQRSVFELAVEEGFEIEAIARIKNIQPNQVESLLIQAKNKLYEILSKRIFTTKNRCYEN